MFGLLNGSSAGSFSVLKEPRRLNMIISVKKLINITTMIKRIFFCRVIRSLDEICRDLRRNINILKISLLQDNNKVN